MDAVDVPGKRTVVAIPASTYWRDDGSPGPTPVMLMLPHKVNLLRRRDELINAARTGGVSFEEQVMADLDEMARLLEMGDNELFQKLESRPIPIYRRSIHPSLPATFDDAPPVTPAGNPRPNTPFLPEGTTRKLRALAQSIFEDMDDNLPAWADDFAQGLGQSYYAPAAADLIIVKGPYRDEANPEYEKTVTRLEQLRVEKKRLEDQRDATITAYSTQLTQAAPFYTTTRSRIDDKADRTIADLAHLDAALGGDGRADVYFGGVAHQVPSIEFSADVHSWAQEDIMTAVISQLGAVGASDDAVRKAGTMLAAGNYPVFPSYAPRAMAIFKEYAATLLETYGNEDSRSRRIEYRKLARNVVAGTLPGSSASGPVPLDRAAYVRPLLQDPEFAAEAREAVCIQLALSGANALSTFLEDNAIAAVGLATAVEIFAKNTCDEDDADARKRLLDGIRDEIETAGLADASRDELLDFVEVFAQDIERERGEDAFFYEALADAINYLTRTQRPGEEFQFEFFPPLFSHDLAAVVALYVASLDEEGGAAPVVESFLDGSLFARWSSRNMPLEMEGEITPEVRKGLIGGATLLHLRNEIRFIETTIGRIDKTRSVPVRDVVIQRGADGVPGPSAVLTVDIGRLSVDGAYGVADLEVAWYFLPALDIEKVVRIVAPFGPANSTVQTLVVPADPGVEGTYWCVVRDVAGVATGVYHESKRVNVRLRQFCVRTNEFYEEVANHRDAAVWEIEAPAWWTDNSAAFIDYARARLGFLEAYAASEVLDAHARSESIRTSGESEFEQAQAEQWGRIADAAERDVAAKKDEMVAAHAKWREERGVTTTVTLRGWHSATTRLPYFTHHSREMLALMNVAGRVDACAYDSPVCGDRLASLDGRAARWHENLRSLADTYGEGAEGRWFYLLVLIEAEAALTGELPVYFGTTCPDVFMKDGGLYEDAATPGKLARHFFAREHVTKDSVYLPGETQGILRPFDYPVFAHDEDRRMESLEQIYKEMNVRRPYWPLRESPLVQRADRYRTGAAALSFTGALPPDTMAALQERIDARAAAARTRAIAARGVGLSPDEILEMFMDFVAQRLEPAVVALEEEVGEEHPYRSIVDLTALDGLDALIALQERFLELKEEYDHAEAEAFAYIQSAPQPDAQQNVAKTMQDAFNSLSGREQGVVGHAIIDNDDIDGINILFRKDLEKENISPDSIVTRAEVVRLFDLSDTEFGEAGEAPAILARLRAVVGSNAFGNLHSMIDRWNQEEPTVTARLGDAPDSLVADKDIALNHEAALAIVSAAAGLAEFASTSGDSVEFLEGELGGEDSEAAATARTNATALRENLAIAEKAVGTNAAMYQRETNSSPSIFHVRVLGVLVGARESLENAMDVYDNQLRAATIEAQRRRAEEKAAEDRAFEAAFLASQLEEDRKRAEAEERALDEEARKEAEEAAAAAAALEVAAKAAKDAEAAKQARLKSLAEAAFRTEQARDAVSESSTALRAREREQRRLAREAAEAAKEADEADDEFEDAFADAQSENEEAARAREAAAAAAAAAADARVQVTAAKDAAAVAREVAEQPAATVAATASIEKAKAEAAASPPTSPASAPATSSGAPATTESTASTSSSSRRSRRQAGEGIVLEKPQPGGLGYIPPFDKDAARAFTRREPFLNAARDERLGDFIALVRTEGDAINALADSIKKLTTRQQLTEAGWTFKMASDFADFYATRARETKKVVTEVTGVINQEVVRKELGDRAVSFATDLTTVSKNMDNAYTALATAFQSAQTKLSKLSKK